MKNGTKAGIFGLGMCVIVALLMAMPVSATGYYNKVTVVADNFDVRTHVDWNTWETQVNTADYTIDYHALNVSWYDERDATDSLNLSFGIYTQTDITNTTIYSNNDIYLQGSSIDDYEMWEGIIDDTNLGASMPIDTTDGVGQVGVVFSHSFEASYGINDASANGIYVWYVDTTDVLQLKDVNLTLTEGRWYSVEKTYFPESKTATINVTDTVSGLSDSIAVTRIRIPVGGLRQMFYGWIVPAGIGPSPLPRVHPSVVYAYQPVAFVDNVDIYGYEFVTSTPPVVVAPVKDWAHDFGTWIFIVGVMTAIGGVIAYQPLEKYASKKGYDNSVAVAAVPVVTGFILAAIGGGIYYGYAGVIHQFWTIVATLKFW